MPDVMANDALVLTDEDDGRLFVVRIYNTGEERVARYYRHRLAGRALRFPRFADPDRPEDYSHWLTEGLGAVAVRPADGR
jgi:hypothetical protein